MARKPTPIAQANMRLIADKSVQQWNEEWIAVKGGFEAPQPQLRSKVGLFRAILGGCVMFVGGATEYRNGGFTKRLGDFRRKGKSGRNHYAGALIHDHLDSLELEILCTGSDRKARETANLLKRPMIELHKPLWNAPVSRRRKRKGITRVHKSVAPVTAAALSL